VVVVTELLVLLKTAQLILAVEVEAVSKAQAQLVLVVAELLF
jgi:hypothetical protein